MVIDITRSTRRRFTPTIPHNAWWKKTGTLVRPAFIWFLSLSVIFYGTFIAHLQSTKAAGATWDTQADWNTWTDLYGTSTTASAGSLALGSGLAGVASQGTAFASFGTPYATVYDTTNAKVYAFDANGVYAYDPVNDIYAVKNATWAGDPPSTYVWDPTDRRVYFFTYTAGIGSSMQINYYDVAADTFFGSATTIPSGLTLTANDAQSAVWDSSNNSIVLLAKNDNDGALASYRYTPSTDTLSSLNTTTDLMGTSAQLSSFFYTGGLVYVVKSNIGNNSSLQSYDVSSGVVTTLRSDLPESRASLWSASQNALYLISSATVDSYHTLYKYPISGTGTPLHDGLLGWIVNPTFNAAGDTIYAIGYNAKAAVYSVTATYPYANGGEAYANFNAGSDVTWNNLTKQETLPGEDSIIYYALGSSSSTCTDTNFADWTQLSFSGSTASLSGIDPSQYLCVGAQLAGDGSTTPELQSLALDYTPLTPSAPANLVATATSSTQINLSWDASDGASGYIVNMATSPGGETSLASASVNSYQVTNLQPGTAYYFTINASSGTGTSSASSEQSATTLTAPTISNLGPSTVIGGQTISSTTPSFSFTTASQGTVKYRIQIDTDSDFSSPVVDYTSALGAASTPTFTVGQAAGSGTYTVGSSSQTLSDGSYYWRVQAIDNGGTASAYSTANSGAVAFVVLSTPPGAPSSLQATVASTTEIDLSWNAPAGSVTGYTVQKSTDGTTFTTVATPTATTQAVTGLQPSTTYTFRVIASNSAGDSSPSSTVQATTQDPPATAISAVSGQPSTSGTATITWTTDHPANSQVEYGLTTSYGSTTTLANTSPLVTSHTVQVTTSVACQTLHYRVLSSSLTSNDYQVVTGGCPANATVVSATNSDISASGGSLPLLDSNNHGVTLTVPNGAVSATTQFQIHQLTTSAVTSGLTLPSGKQAVGSFFQMLALTNTATAVDSFSQPLSVTIAYAQSDVQGLDTSTLAIQRWDEGTGWTPLTNCSSNSTALTVTCQTSNFSTFALFADAVQPSPTASASSTGSDTADNGSSSLTSLPVTGSSSWVAAIPVLAVVMAGLHFILNPTSTTLPQPVEQNLPTAAPEDPSSPHTRRRFTVGAEIHWQPIGMA